jgi:murein DD-endopeptidase MepM/ murein hydrolase activator NlpD
MPSGRVGARYRVRRGTGGAWKAYDRDLSSNFGECGRERRGYPHTGTDIAGDEGRRCAPRRGGLDRREQYLYGNVIYIDHRIGLFSGYGHLSQILVTAGRCVVGATSSR